MCARAQMPALRVRLKPALRNIPRLAIERLPSVPRRSRLTARRALGPRNARAMCAHRGRFFLIVYACILPRQVFRFVKTTADMQARTARRTWAYAAYFAGSGGKAGREVGIAGASSSAKGARRGKARWVSNGSGTVRRRNGAA